MHYYLIGVSLAILASFCVAEPHEEEIASGTREAKGKFWKYEFENSVR